MQPRVRFFARTALMAGLLCIPAGIFPVGSSAQAALVVMTQNLYVGASPDAVVTALAGGNAADISAAGEAFYNKVLATNYPARAAAMAAEIRQYQPALIGLQEMALYRSGPAGNPAPATDVEIDFLGTLLGALNARGLHYAAIAVGSTTDVESTTKIGGVPRDLRLTDRNAIIYNTDLTPAQLTLSNPQNGIFANHVTIPTAPSGSITLYQGWNSVDVVADGMSFRFLNAHLTTTGGVGDAFQWGQAQELINGPGNTTLPQLYVGDYNSRASGTPQFTYNNMVAAGLQDAWNQVHPADSGYTWGQGELLNNFPSTFTKRIDLVMTRNSNMQVTAADVVGEDPADRTPSGLWPSDHAGVVVTLVPEPTSWALAALGAATSVTARAIRRRRALCQA